MNPLAEDIEYTCCAKAREAGNFEEHICDRPKIRKIIGEIAATYMLYAESGSTAWDLTLDMTNLPAWIHEAAENAAIEEIAAQPCFPCTKTIFGTSSVNESTITRDVLLPDGWVQTTTEGQVAYEHAETGAMSKTKPTSENQSLLIEHWKLNNITSEDLDAESLDFETWL